VRVNEALAALNGVPVDEHFGRTLRDVLGEELAALNAAARLKASRADARAGA